MWQDNRQRRRDRSAGISQRADDFGRPPGCRPPRIIDTSDWHGSQRHAEAGAELGEVGAVDSAVSVEVERRIGDGLAEAAAELGEVSAVHGAVVVGIAEEATEQTAV